MMYRYGMTFKTGTFAVDPQLWEVFPFWTPEEELEMEMAQAEAQMAALARSGQ